MLRNNAADANHSPLEKLREQSKETFLGKNARCPAKPPCTLHLAPRTPHHNMYYQTRWVWLVPIGFKESFSVLFSTVFRSTLACSLRTRLQDWDGKARKRPAGRCLRSASLQRI